MYEETSFFLEFYGKMYYKIFRDVRVTKKLNFSNTNFDLCWFVY